jgi:hypothetical protein
MPLVGDSIQPINLAQIFAGAGQMMQLQQARKAQERQDAFYTALQRGDMVGAQTADPVAFTALQQKQLEAQKTGLEMARTNQTITKDKAAATLEMQQRVGKALESDPRWSAHAQRAVDDAARRGEINHFQVVGADTANTLLDPGQVGPQALPTRGEVDAAQRMAGVEDQWTKPTDEMREYAAASGKRPDDPGFGPGFERYQLTQRQASSGQAPLAMATGLRKEFSSQPSVRAYGVVRQGLANIASASANGVGDMSTVYSFMKMLDTNSAVRESETAMAQGAGGYIENMKSILQRASGKGSLTGPLRQAFLAEAKKLEAAYRAGYDVEADNFKRIASENGLNPGDVVFAFPDTRRGPPGGQTRAPAGNTSGGVRDVEFTVPPPGTPPMQVPAPGQRREPPAQAVSFKTALDEYDQLTGGR